MSKIEIYAAGAISNTTYAGATNWYDDVSRRLDGRFSLLTPMRAKEFLVRGGEEHLNHDCQRLVTDEIEQQAIRPNFVMGRDAWDVSRCDAVFMNLLETPDKVSIGCMMELGMAFAHRKPVVLCVSPNDSMGVLRHPMVAYSVIAHADNIKDGVSFLQSLFCDD